MKDFTVKLLFLLLQGRVLFSVFFFIIVLGLAFLRQCDSSTCKGILPIVCLFLHLR